MTAELEPLRAALGLRAEGDGLDAVHRGRHGDRAVVALLTGIGMTRAEVRARHLIETHAVDHAVVIGVAGGIAEGLAIGDVVVPEVVVDRRDGRELVPTDLASGSTAEPGRPRPHGRLLSGDDFVKDHERLRAMRAEGAVAIDMETAAIGRVCEDAGLAWSVFRAISDDAFDPFVDDDILALTNPDGSFDPAAVERYLATDPDRAALLTRLGRDLEVATAAAVDAALASFPKFPR